MTREQKHDESSVEFTAFERVLIGILVGCVLWDIFFYLYAGR